MSTRFFILTCLWLTASCIAAAERGLVLVRDQAGRQVVGRYEESHALLVGVSDYTAGWPDLESVPRELDRVERMLKARGFNVVRVPDSNAEQLERAFKDFIDAYGYRRGNRLLFFFAGHGHTWEEQGHGYLVPSDAPRPATETGDPGPEFLRKALFMSDILAWSRQMTANHALFLFDSCFSGAVFKERALPAKPPYINRAMALPVREFITAGSAGEKVPARSVFTPAFVDALEYAKGDLNGDGYITGMELGLHLWTTVPRHARQTPQFGKHPQYELSQGDFVFALGKSGPTTPPREATDAVEVPRREPDAYADAEAGERAVALTQMQRRRVQAALNALGWDAGPADGEFGPLTRRALAAYQRSLGVTATGYLSAEQLAQLYAKSGERVPSRALVAPGKTWKDPVTGMEFVWIPAGCFEMGNEDADSDERPVHRVCVQGLWLGKHEVTKSQWNRVMGESGLMANILSMFRGYPVVKTGGDYPVEEISWKDVQAFIAKLNGKGRGGLRLPSEAEWEYACRGGGRSEAYCGGEKVDRLAWYGYNSRGSTHPVGRKQANGLGLHDMSGNVWEWVQDCYRGSYQGAPVDGSARDAGKCARRVLRGGSWDNKPRYVHAANRDGASTALRDSAIGFRLARTP